MARRRGGPYVAVAAFCDRVLNEKDDVLSVIRIVDQLIVEVRDVQAAPDLATVRLNALISLKAGDLEGTHELKIRTDPPKIPGAIRKINRLEVVQPVTFAADISGINHILTMEVPIPMRAEGPVTFWFDVLVDDKRLTRMPLRVIYQAAEGGPVEGAGAQDPAAARARTETFTPPDPNK